MSYPGIWLVIVQPRGVPRRPAFTDGSCPALAKCGNRTRALLGFGMVPDHGIEPLQRSGAILALVLVRQIAGLCRPSGVFLSFAVRRVRYSVIGRALPGFHRQARQPSCVLPPPCGRSPSPAISKGGVWTPSGRPHAPRRTMRHASRLPLPLLTESVVGYKLIRPSPACAEVVLRPILALLAPHHLHRLRLSR